MKILNKIIMFILVVVLLFSGIVLFLAFNPDTAAKVGDKLSSWGIGAGRGTSGEADDGPVGGASGQGSPSSALDGDAANTGGSDADGDGLAAGVGGDVGAVPEFSEGSLVTGGHSDYVPQTGDETIIPADLSGRNGYCPVEGKNSEVAPETGQEILDRLGYGNTGDTLSFDALIYPYYQMLDQKGRHLYRQIYANAGDLTPAFVPIEDVTADQLRDVFSAVYNDHPELFWMETAYTCKYLNNGRCIELDLEFNRTAQDLATAKKNFDQCAFSILQTIGSADGAYEKERKVHDRLIELVSYNANSSMNQSAYSALVNGQTVCAGYARAYQYLLQQLGIPCYYCVGYAGENHAWNIVMLDDGFYNVDVTWDDVENGHYTYFNRTDSDFAINHRRTELSVYLPACNGKKYRGLAKEETSAGTSTGTAPAAASRLRSISDVGVKEEDVYKQMKDYYADCLTQIKKQGLGSFSFYNVIEGDVMREAWYATYQSGTYKQEYMDEAMKEIKAESCRFQMVIEELEDNRYLITHYMNFW